MALLVALAGCASLSSVHTSRADPSLQVHTLREGYANAHLIVQGQRSVLIDSGLEENALALEARIREVGVDPATLDAIIITHGHADHAGGAGHFKRLYGTTIIAGTGDHGMYATGQHRDEPMCPVGSVAEGRMEDDRNQTYTPVSIDIAVEDQPLDLHKIAGIQGQIVPLPGHTPGSLVVVFDRFAAVGDLLRGEILGSDAAIHFYMCDLEDNRRDIRTLLDTLAPKADVFLAGHFGPLDRSDLEDLLSDWSP